MATMEVQGDGSGPRPLYVRRASTWEPGGSPLVREPGGMATLHQHQSPQVIISQWVTPAVFFDLYGELTTQLAAGTAVRWQLGHWAMD